MVVIEFEMDYEDNVLRAKSWYYLSREKANKLQLELNKNPSKTNKLIKIFDTGDIPEKFYQYAQEYFLDEIKLRRYYKKK